MFVAKYTGKCVECGTEVQGRQVRFFGTGKELIHIVCPFNAGDVCPDCNILRPCSCDDY